MKKIRVWLYCRSANRKAADFVMKKQEYILRQAVDVETHEVVGLTREFGTGLDINRPALNQLLKNANGNIMDEIWFTEGDRICHDYVKMQEWVKNIVGCGVAACMHSGYGQMINRPLPNFIHAAMYYRVATKQQMNQ